MGSQVRNTKQRHNQHFSLFLMQRSHCIQADVHSHSTLNTHTHIATIDINGNQTTATNYKTTINMTQSTPSFNLFDG